MTTEIEDKGMDYENEVMCDGNASFQLGRELSDNPHPLYGRESHDWITGWAIAAIGTVQSWNKVKIMITENKNPDPQDWIDNSGIQPALLNVDVMLSNGRIRRCLTTKELDWSLDIVNPISKYKKPISVEKN